MSKAANKRPCAPPMDKWTIVRDPPNGLRTFTIFDTEPAARKCLEGLRRNGTGDYLTLFAPTSGAGIIL